MPSLRDGFEALSRTGAAKGLQGGAPAHLNTAPTAAPTAAPKEVQSNPWDFRGGPDSEIGKVIQEMVDRARESDVTIDGQTVESLLILAIFANPDITNEQILAMSQLELDDVDSTPEAIARTEQEIPDSRELPSHQFTVDLLHAVTGIDKETLSRYGPDLGMSGSAEMDAILPWNRGEPFLWAPGSDRERLSTALHDFTDVLRLAGIEGVQDAIWGTESQFWSAIWSQVNGVPDRFLVE